MEEPTPPDPASRSTPTEPPEPEKDLLQIHLEKKARSRKTIPPPPGMDPKEWRLQREREARERRLAALAKAQASIRLKRQQRALVRKKVEADLPITEQEREILGWSPTESRKQREKRLLDSVAKLVITPKTVDELRLVVEQTAARHQYNPIEALIKLTGPNSDLDDKEKANIHTKLLPFLAPQVPTPKATTTSDRDEKKVRVTVTQFVFPERSQNNVTPLHKERPKSVVETTATETPTPAIQP